MEVIGKAQAAKAPSSPNTKRNTLLGAVLLLVLSCGATILVYLLDNTVKARRISGSASTFPYSGKSPASTREPRRCAAMLAKKKENVSRSAAALTSKTPFQIVEAYKAIRANLLFMLSTAAEKAVVVTSAEPSAGKSTTCSNLASPWRRRGQGGHRGRRYAQASSAQDFPRQQQQRLGPSCSAA